MYDEKVAGYYTVQRRHVKEYLDYDAQKVPEETKEDSVYAKALESLDPALVEELGLEGPNAEKSPETERKPDVAPATPICDRCHNLLHYHQGTPIHHPSVEAIQQTIAESPHRRNHIYHVIDAADFPLSLIPNLQSTLRLPKLRTQNRRAKHKGWVGENRIAEVSFIVTRSDLLAPQKEQVDKLLPYVQDVLRDALGRVNRNARLGNVHLVSAVRGWWTKKIKEDIWDRGGAGWMVGKVNVGKSKLYGTVFPKGRGGDYVNVAKIRSQAEREQMIADAKTVEELAAVHKLLAEEDKERDRRRRQPVLEPQEGFPEEDPAELDPDSLLPPRQPFKMFPAMPLQSSLPGTTASPIRIPYGNNRGELIDLPGIARTNPDLSSFVASEFHSELVMKSRVKPDRLVLKPGQSLVLGGGLVRITPTNPDIIYIVHAFVPLHPHVTATPKAVALQAQDGSSPHVPSILAPYAGRSMRSAGTYKLKWDVTKQLGGPLTSKMAGKMKPENLPFTIWSTDLLIEGVGWVEISAQVRKPKGWKPVGMVKKDPNHAKHEREARLAEAQRIAREKYEAKIAAGEGDAFDRAGFGRPTTTDEYRKQKEQEEKRELAEELVSSFENPYPEVEVFTPLGKYVGARRPMCGSVLGGPKPVTSRERMARPRRSMKSVRGKAVAGKKEARKATSSMPSS